MINRKEAIKKAIAVFTFLLFPKLFADKTDAKKNAIPSLQNIKSDPIQFENRELTEKVFLCKEDGTLNPESIGWSRHPLQVANLSGNWPVKKRWNYWCITGPDFMFSITLTDLDYAGMIFAYFLDYKTKEFTEDSILIPFGKNIQLGENVSDDAFFKSEKCSVVMKNRNGTTELEIEWKDFKGKKLSSKIKIYYPNNHETLSVVVPWDKSRFQFTSKHNSLPAEGNFSIGERNFNFNKEESFGCLDFGRGIWPRKIAWNWGSFSGKSGKDMIGLNLGGRWTDGSGISENAICVNSKLNKIREPVKFVYDKGDFMKPWRIKSTISDTVDIVFTPFYERVAISDFFIIQSEVHQMFGKYSGKVRFDGRIFHLKDLTGWAEDHEAKW